MTQFADIFPTITRAERARLSAGLGGIELDAVAKDHRSIANWVLHTLADRLGQPVDDLFPHRFRPTVHRGQLLRGSGSSGVSGVTTHPKPA